MAWLTRMMNRIGANLRDLSISQRLVILLGGLLVGGSLLWLVQWAATPEMVPLILQDLDADEMTQAKIGLEQLNEPFVVKGNRILVRSSANKPALVAQLSLQDKLPESTSTGFEALVKANNPWLSDREHDRQWTVALTNELEAVLRKITGVKSADVFLDLNARQQQVIGRRIESRASITLAMKGGMPVTRKLAVGVARLVSGAVRGVKLTNVSVVDAGTGTSALEWDNEDPSSGSALQKSKLDQEKQIERKIRGQLGDLKARVSVQVELEMTSKTSQTNTPIEGAPIREESDNSNRTRGSTAGNPGAQANVGIAANGSGTQSTETRDTKTTEYKVGETLESRQTPGGAVMEIQAAINISYSYLEGIFRRQNPDVEKPTTQNIMDIFEAEKLRIVSQVTKLVKPHEPEQVAVDWYYDSVDLGLGAAGDGSDGASLDTTMDMVKRYGPQSALGMLALVSFALMLNMSKKIDASDSFGLDIGLPAEHIEAAKQAARDLADEASRTSPKDGKDGIEAVTPGPTGAAEGLLVGREVDEPTLQMQSMLDQVGTFVGKDPAVVADLFERWVKDDK